MSAPRRATGALRRRVHAVADRCSVRRTGRPGRYRGENAMLKSIGGLCAGLALLFATSSAQADVHRVVVVEVSDTSMYVKEIDNIRSAMKRLKLEGSIRVMRARFAGKEAGAIVVAASYPDMAALAAADTALAADAENQATMRRIGALRKIVSDSLYEDL
jgi:hypothetical protein